MSKKDEHFIVVGGGHAAGQLIDSLRQEGFQGKITLLAEEAMLPYQRPHLSKLYLSGELPQEKLLYRPESFYADNNINCLLQKKVESIDVKAKQIQTTDGERLDYDKLALTIGARVRRLDIPGSDAGGVHYLRSIADTDKIRSEIQSASNIVLIGGGFLGLEAASVLSSKAKNTTVIEVQERVMANAVAPEISTYYENMHRGNGVNLVCGTGVESINTENGKVVSVICNNGESYSADLLIISVGVHPNDELAATAGLECDDGICVDEYAQTSDANIVAAGDCTRHPNDFLEKKLRLESVHNAVEQAKTAAASMCGRKMIYRQVPWFWSDQYHCRLQMVGIADDGDERLVLGQPEQGSFSILFFRNGKLSACHAVNRPKDYMNCRKILENGIALTRAEASAGDFDLSSLVPNKTRLALQQRDKEQSSLSA
jgi:3-phenylpropionate/trans-cinnamate dioxygenase ferredoxin reductase subunit